MKLKLLVTFSLLFITLISWTQSKQYVEFQSKTIEIVENIHDFSWTQFSKESMYNAGYFGYLVFGQLPSQSIQDDLKEKNMLLLDYLRSNTYLFYFPENTSISYLKSIGVTSVIPIDPETKIASNLLDRPFGDWAIENNRILINLEFYDTISLQTVVSGLKNKDIIIKKTNEFFPIITVAVHEEAILEVASHVFVKYMEQIAPPATHDDTRGKSLHRISAVNTKYATGRKYTGNGIGVMVRDDGNVGPHIDFQGRIDNSWAGSMGGNHGDGVAGIMCGAGNLDPYMEGMAPEASLYVVNYVADHLDTATNTLINNGSVQLTNSSYSNGCNAGYTSTTRTVDTQSNTNLNLLHVFSAGNSNGNNCGYGAGSQWGNITGGHKQGKNVIATANIYYDGELVSSSSRGPAYDGRIKPDIAANGQNQMSTDHNNTYRPFGGTSGAAPNIVGVAAACYDAYNQLHGSLPNASLIKATLLNTANDLGNVGPDYKFGWGHVNALRSVKLLEDNRFLNDNIIQGVSNTHNISIPTGTREVRFMLYWNDPAANSGATTALVNDLDLTVTDTANNTLLPWVLDPTPNATTLNLPATNGIDRLNNMEQVLIENPVAGNYTIHVNGFNIPEGPQNYFIVYEILNDEIDLIYPLGGESFTPGDNEIIHWDASNDVDNVLIEYTTDNGASWLTIATVPSSDRLYHWNVPATISGQCKIRVTKNSFTSESHEVFYIATEVSGVNLTQVCPDQMIVNCNAVPNAVLYELYVLGAETMELIGSSTNTTINATITDPNSEKWYAVKAIGADGWKTKRTIAKYHAGGLFNCSLNNDLELTSIITPNEGISCGGNSETVSVTITNTGIDNQQNFEILYQLNSEPVVSEIYTPILNSGHTTSYSFTQVLAIVPNTNYTLTVWVNLTDDENPTNDQKIVTFLNLGDITAPWLDDVELHAGTTSSNIGNCWASSPSNNANDFRWNVVSNGGQTPSDYTGPNAPNSGSNYFYTEASSPATTGDVAELITPTVAISGLNTPILSFYYHMYGVAMGSLHVDVFNNGTWYNDEIVISGQQQTTGSDLWVEQTLILSAFTGEVKIRFRGIRGSDYTSDIALDDISILEAPSCPKPNNLTVATVSFNSVDLTWNPGNTESYWQIEYGVDGFTQGTGILLQVNTSFHTISGLNSNTDYDVYLRANCGAAPGDDDSLWVGPLSFTTLFDYCNGDHFYDSGGPSSNYSNSENIVTTIAPSTGYDLVSVQFNSFQTEAGYDYLSVYDGPDTASTLIGTYDGTASLGTFTSTHATGSLTFHFTSDGSITRSGWDATVTCVSVSCPIPSSFIASSVDFTSVEFDWTAGGSETQWQIEYGLNGFTQGSGTVVQATAKPYLLTGLTMDTNYDAYIRANCGTAPGDDDSPWVGPISFTTLGIIDPVNLVASIDQATGNVMLNWDVSSNTENTQAFLNYDIYRNTVVIGTSTSTAYLDNLTVPGPGTYEYYITAVFDEGTSNPSNTVSVVFEGVSDIAVNPLSMSETLQQETTLTQILSISNTGNNELTFSLATSGASWLSFSPANGTVASNTSTDVTVQFNATGLDIGTYNTNIILTSNDPDTPEITIPVSLIVTVNVGTADYEIENLSYYPNPTNTLLTISASEILESITIYSILGQEVVSKEIFHDYTAEIDMSNLSAGTYLIKIIADSKINMLRIIKK